MRISTALVLVVGSAVIALAASLIVRDGLLAIAHEIRDKPMPKLPDTLNIRAITVEHATLHNAAPGSPAGGSAASSPIDMKITIENMRLESLMPTLPKPATPQPDKPQN